MTNDFCIYVISHQRSGRVHTIGALRRAGYTGPIRVVVDDKDPELDEYREEFGEDLLVFSKDDYEDRIDLADNEEGHQTPLYVREACWDFAEEMGLTYFCVMDDYYDWFGHRIGPRGQYLSSTFWVKDMDSILDAFVEYMKDAPITSIAFSQGGDWIGGEGNTYGGLAAKRKVMNSFVLSTERRFTYKGRLNDDVNTYVLLGSRGQVFLTYMPVQLNQGHTQEQAGGITEEYLRFGTYAKSFYTVMMAPSCTTVTVMGESNLRPHHRVSWRHAVPKIVPEKHRKADS